MADYDVNINLKTKADVSGLKETSKVGKEVQQITEKISESSAEASKATLELSDTFQESAQSGVDYAVAMSKVEALTLRLTSQGNKLSKALGADKIDPGKVGNYVLSIQKTLRDIDKITKPEPEPTPEVEQTREDRISASGLDEIAYNYNKLSAFKSAVLETFNAIEQVGSSAVSRASSAIGSFVKQMGQSAVNKVTSFAKSISNVVNAFKRIMFYRMVRTLIKEIGQAFGEGIKNLYQWSKLLNGEFAQSMDQIATAGLYMKNSLGAMVSPLINALAPAVDYLIDRFVALLNVINQVLAALTGAATWTKAIKYQTEYAKAAGSGAANTKKLGLATIDQLTILDKHKGSSGSGFTADDYANMFETEKISGVFEKIKEAIERGDWQGAGKLLAEELNKIIDKFDAEAWGRKLGEKIDHGIQFAYGFLKNLNFTTIGQKIADALNGGIGAIDWETVGRLFTRGYTILADTVIGFITRLDWKQVGSAINNAIIGALNEFNEWLDTVDFTNLGETIPQKLTDFIEGLDLMEVGKAFWTVFWKFIQKSFEAQFGMFKSTWDLVGKYIVDTTDKTGEKTVNVMDKYWADAESDTKSIWDEIVDIIWEHGLDAERHVDTNLSNTEKRMILFGAEAKRFTKEDWDNIVQTVSTKAGELKTNAMTKIEDFVRKLGEAWENIKRNADTKWSNIKSTISGWIEKIKGLLNFNWSLPNIKLPHFRVSGSFGWSWNGGITVPSIYVDWYAKGGFPDAGDLFIANENGAEMVGSMNGRTAVANQQEITDGIREGVYDAMVSALGNGKLTANVYLDGKQISGTVVNNINSETRRTGNSPLLSY